jgi:uncharacterized protein involved in exopolysaccharide biosynthesis
MERGIDVGAAVWRGRWLIVVAGLVGAVMGFVVSLAQTPLYTSSARVLVKPTALNPPGSVPLPATISMPTEVEIATSGTVLGRARERLEGKGAELGTVTATFPVDTQILVITSTHTNPKTSAAVANAVAEAYLEFRSEQAIASAERAIEQAQKQIAGLQQRAGELAREIRTSGPGETASLTNELEQVNGQISLWRAAASQYNISGLDPGTIVAPATGPADPSSPNRAADVLRGLIAGLLAGLVITLVRAAARAARERA